MRIGIAGTGTMGRVHAEAWNKTSAKITGVLGTDAGEIRELARRFGAEEYHKLDNMLRDIDVLDICVPTFLHHSFVIAAAKGGIHVICEKPLARNLKDAREMVEACRQAGVKLLPAHVLRFSAEYMAARSAMERGELGEAAILRFSRESYAPKRKGDNWFLDYERSGGILLDLSYHDMDCARWLAGDVRSVYAQNVRSSHPDFPGDYALIILEHESGALSHIESSWAMPEPEFHTSFEIAGSRGLLQFSSGEAAPIGLDTHRAQISGGPSGRVALPNLQTPEEGPYEREIRMFYEHLTDGRPLPVCDADALSAMEIALGAIESAKSGKPLFPGKNPPHEEDHPQKIPPSQTRSESSPGSGSPHRGNP